MLFIYFFSPDSSFLFSCTYNHLLFFVYSMILPAAACSLGLNVGQDCRVEDKDAGYVFDLTPLAKKTWGQKDFVTAVNNINSQYKYRLKVRNTQLSLHMQSMVICFLLAVISCPGDL